MFWPFLCKNTESNTFSISKKGLIVLKINYLKIIKFVSLTEIGGVREGPGIPIPVSWGQYPNIPNSKEKYPNIPFSKDQYMYLTHGD